MYVHHILCIAMGRSKRIVALYYNYHFLIMRVKYMTILHCQLAYGRVGERVGREATGAHLII